MEPALPRCRSPPLCCPLIGRLQSQCCAPTGVRHFIGKGHLGVQTVDHLPANRGFESHVGYLGGGESYRWGGVYGSARDPPVVKHHDMWHTHAPATDLVGQIDYSTSFYAGLAVDRITSRNASRSLWLHLTFQVLTPLGPAPTPMPTHTVSKPTPMLMHTPSVSPPIINVYTCSSSPPFDLPTFRPSRLAPPCPAFPRFPNPPSPISPRRSTAATGARTFRRPTPSLATAQGCTRTSSTATMGRRRMRLMTALATSPMR